jgi:Ca2+-binding RTX toxin-like protein
VTVRRLTPAVLVAVAAGVGAAQLAAAGGDPSATITRQGTEIEINGSVEVDHLTVAGSSGGEITVSSDTGQIFAGLSGGACTSPDAGMMTQECNPSGISKMQVFGNDSGDELSTPGQFTVPLRVFGAAGGDTIIGGPSEETLDGNDGADVLKGAAGRDELLGKAGRDSLNGGAKSDGCSGGKGTDTVKKCERRPDPVPPID